MELRLQEPFHWKSTGGRPDVSPSKKRIPALSLALCLEIARFFETWSYSKKRLAALTSRPSLKIEPTSRQISEESLESLKLRERNFKHQTTPEQPVKPTEGHPQE